MRVTPVVRTADAERGAVAVVVAICSVVLFGMAAFAIDTGALWTSRRHMVTATDAAALGAARDYALGDDGCATTAPSLLETNYGGASMTGCVATTTGPTSGYVTVDGEREIELTFAGIFGISSSTVRSTTAATWGMPYGLEHLRPLGLCVDSPAFQAWLAAGMPTPYEVTIPYTKESPDACGDSAPGNWGVLDFDGGANSNNDTRAWIRNGYPELVESGSSIPGDTGAFSQSLSSALDGLVGPPAVTFHIPVYDAVAGNGANARFRLVGFVTVELVGYRATGPEATRYLRLQFRTGLAQGRCCADGLDTGVRVIAICAVDATFDPQHCTPGT